MFSQVSVILSGVGGVRCGGVHGEEACMAGGVRCGGVHGEEACMAGGVRALQRTVRILLECILV